MSWAILRSPKHSYMQGQFFPLPIVSRMWGILLLVQRKNYVRMRAYGLLLIFIRKHSLEFGFHLVPEGLFTAIETIMMT